MSPMFVTREYCFIWNDYHATFRIITIAGFECDWDLVSVYSVSTGDIKYNTKSTFKVHEIHIHDFVQPGPGDAGRLKLCDLSIKKGLLCIWDIKKKIISQTFVFWALGPLLDSKGCLNLMGCANSYWFVSFIVNNIVQTVQYFPRCQVPLLGPAPPLSALLSYPTTSPPWPAGPGSCHRPHTEGTGSPGTTGPASQTGTSFFWLQ